MTPHEQTIVEAIHRYFPGCEDRGWLTEPDIKGGSGTRGQIKRPVSGSREAAVTGSVSYEQPGLFPERTP